MQREKTGQFGEGGSPAVCKNCGKVSEEFANWQVFYSWYCTQACYKEYNDKNKP